MQETKPCIDETGLFDYYIARNVQYGDNIQGGVLFYVGDDDRKGLVAVSAPQYTASPFDPVQKATIIQYGNDPWQVRIDTPSPNVFSTSPEIFEGRSNTTKIVNAVGAGLYPAKICNDLTLTGYNDWYLPSEKELLEMGKNAFPLTNGGTFWSSTQSTSDPNYAMEVVIPKSVPMSTCSASMYKASRQPFIPVRAFLLSN